MQVFHLYGSRYHLFRLSYVVGAHLHMVPGSVQLFPLCRQQYHIRIQYQLNLGQHNTQVLVFNDAISCLFAGVATI